MITIPSAVVTLLSELIVVGDEMSPEVPEVVQPDEEGVGERGAAFLAERLGPEVGAMFMRIAYLSHGRDTRTLATMERVGHALRLPGRTFLFRRPASVVLRLVVDLLGADGEARRQAAATWAILGNDAQPVAVTNHAREIRALADELAAFIGTELPGILARGEWGDEEPRAVETDAGRILWLDEMGARLLERIGKSGAEAAQAMREDAVERWASFAEPGLLDFQPNALGLWRVWARPRAPIDPTAWALNVAKALWLDRVRISFAKDSPPSLSLPLFDRLVIPMRAPVTVDGSRLLASDGTVIEELASPMKEGIPAIEIELLDELRTRGFRALATVNGPRVLWWLVSTAHRQWEEGAQRYDRIEVDGGWNEVARRVLEASSVDSNASRTWPQGEIKAILWALASRGYKRPDGMFGNLAILAWRDAYRGRGARVEITLHDSLLPFSVREISKTTREGRRARLLTAMLPPPPPSPGSRRYHHGESIFALDLVAELSRRSADVAEAGGLEDPRWEERERLAARAGLDPKPLRVAWAHMTGIGYFAEPKPGLIQLGRMHRNAWRFLLAGGRKRPPRAPKTRRGRR